MKEEQIVYKSYSVTVFEKDLDPFVERFEKRIRINFISPRSISYSTKYEEGGVHGRPEKIKNNGR